MSPLDSMMLPPGGNDDALPWTIEWPPQVAAELVAKGIHLMVGSELFERFASRPRNLGWNPENQSWAGVPLEKDAGLPPRALAVVRRGADGVEVVLSLIEDTDHPEETRRVKLPEEI